MESFNTDQSVQQEQPTDQLTFKVGEREFNAEAAAKKITAADEHIARIERENQEYREKMAALEAQVQQSTKLEDALQKLQSADQPESRSQDNTTSFDPEKLSQTAKEAALQALQEQEQARALQEQKAIAERTFNETKAALAAIYGENLDEAVQQHAGVSLQTAIKMAQDPEQSKALLKLMKVESKPSATPSSDINTLALSKRVDPNKPLFEGGKAPTNKQIVDILLNN